MADSPPGDRDRVPRDQSPLPRNSTPGTGGSSEVVRAGARVVARARPRDQGSGGGASARGGWPNGTRERGRRGRGSQGRSVPALCGPGGPLTSLRPGALSRQPGSAAATAAPEPGSGHCCRGPRLRPTTPPSRPLPAPATPATRPARAPCRPPGGGGPPQPLFAKSTHSGWPVDGSTGRNPGCPSRFGGSRRPWHCPWPLALGGAGTWDGRTRASQPAPRERCERGACPGRRPRGAPGGWVAPVPKPRG